MTGRPSHHKEIVEFVEMAGPEILGRRISFTAAMQCIDRMAVRDGVLVDRRRWFSCCSFPIIEYQRAKESTNKQGQMMR